MEGSNHERFCGLGFFAMNKYGEIMKNFMLITMLILLPIQAQAQVFFYGGNHLVELMREYENPNTSSFGAGRYSGFVSGVYDTLSALNIICPTTSVTVGQAIAIVTKYLKSNPEKWNESAIDLVSVALMNAFPCKK